MATTLRRAVALVISCAVVAACGGGSTAPETLPSASGTAAAATPTTAAPTAATAAATPSPTVARARRLENGVPGLAVGTAGWACTIARVKALEWSADAYLIGAFSASTTGVGGQPSIGRDGKLPADKPESRWQCLYQGPKPDSNGNRFFQVLVDRAGNTTTAPMLFGLFGVLNDDPAEDRSHAVSEWALDSDELFAIARTKTDKPLNLFHLVQNKYVYLVFGGGAPPGDVFVDPALTEPKATKGGATGFAVKGKATYVGVEITNGIFASASSDVSIDGTTGKVLACTRCER